MAVVTGWHLAKLVLSSSPGRGPLGSKPAVSWQSCAGNIRTAAALLQLCPGSAAAAQRWAAWKWMEKFETVGLQKCQGQEKQQTVNQLGNHLWAMGIYFYIKQDRGG